MDAAIVAAIRRLLMEGMRACRTRNDPFAGDGCNASELGHLWGGEAVVLDAGPSAGGGFRTPVVGLDSSHAGSSRMAKQPA